MTSVQSPLLIEEIEGDNEPVSYALVLERLETLNKTPSALNKYDIIVCFIFVIMLEQGFIPLHCAEEFSSVGHFEFDKQRVHNLCKRLPDTWKKSNSLYELSFVLGCFRRQQCRLLCTICMDDLLVNCSVQGVQNGNYSMLIDPSQYVIDSRISLRKRFQHIKHFATNFKNAIANPAKWDVLQVNDVPTPRLQDLPPELKNELEKLVKVEFFNDL